MAISKAAEDEALAALMTDSASGNALEATGPSLKLYGFADFTFSNLLNRDTLGTSRKWSTFSVGNVNLYADSQISRMLHSLVEVRFMYLPNGAVSGIDLETYQPDGSPVARTNTTVADYTDVDRPIQWGGISIQRAYMEATLHQWLTIRGGHFLTPYGIWNVDHGSPVFISVRRPFIVGQQLFPSSQTGLEAYGTFSINATQFGYHVTLSNGRGPLSTYQDFDENKAIGWRAFARNESSLGTLTLGLSGYRGTYTDRVPEQGALSVNEVMTKQYRELALGIDVKWEHRGALVQAEAILKDTSFTNSVRPVASPYDPGPPGFNPDYRQWGTYGLIGYRTPFWGIMPFFSAEYHRALSGASAAVLGGLNIRPMGHFVLKLVATRVWFIDIPLDISKDMIDLQTAWSF